jgi:hypothetical protein
MAITEKELTEFHAFARQRLANGGAESMADLARLWDESRSEPDSEAALRQSHEDAEAGRIFSAEEVLSDARKILRIAE